MSLAGVLVLARHGDRQGFYQSPTTYTAQQTNLTVLGYLQEYQNGVDLRARYLGGNGSADAVPQIQGIDATKAEDTEVKVLADAGGEGSTIVDSAYALMQGLYPPYNESITLANGTTVSWGTRAQLISVETIEADQEVWLEGYTDCNTWTDRLNSWYTSDEFLQRTQDAQPFYDQMKGVLGEGRSAVLKNAWNIFDFLNVENIHNATLAPSIGSQNVSTARYWADYHESGSFADPDPNSVGNIAGTALLPLLSDNLNQIANASNPLKFVTIAAAYKPFLALGSLFDVPELNNSVVDYASTLVFEVSTSGDLSVFFRNGTVNATYTPLNLFGSSATSLPLSSFQSNVEPYTISTRADWCNKCGTTDARGCDVLAALNGTGGAGYASPIHVDGHHRVSPVTAGLIGAFVTLAVVAILSAALFAMRKVAGASRRRRTNVASSGGLELPARSDGASIASATSSGRGLVDHKS